MELTTTFYPFRKSSIREQIESEFTHDSVLDAMIAESCMRSSCRLPCFQRAGRRRGPWYESSCRGFPEWSTSGSRGRRHWVGISCQRTEVKMDRSVTYRTTLSAVPVTVCLVWSRVDLELSGVILSAASVKRGLVTLMGTKWDVERTVGEVLAAGIRRHDEQEQVWRVAAEEYIDRSAAWDCGRHRSAREGKDCYGRVMSSLYWR
nr:hypothetical protein CFP56_38993 [Quercus suber]